MRRCATSAAAWVATGRRTSTLDATRASNRRSRSRVPATPEKRATAAVAAAAAAVTTVTASTPPTAEDYRALLLDLLLYRRETVTPVVEALRRERELLETDMRHLDAHVRELSRIRDELRQLSEAALDAERRRLHRTIAVPGISSVPAGDVSAVEPGVGDTPETITF
ncbi:hypothetical protein NESM_000790200 [Novymonas esmeraldas]|uniref:Uncharacterized protein n=1 Tax=Novymonas esmeraldas TaxID=1808958 RepID=A0AAW0EW32_9TRYP